MSLHPQVKMDQSTPYSALSIGHNLSPPMIGEMGGPRVVPIIPYKHASKWNSTIYKQDDPFTVNFDTHGMPSGFGVKHGDLASYSASIMNTVIVRGGDPVFFPARGKRIQFRIVWPGYDAIDFSASIDIHEITVCELAGRVASLYTEFQKRATQHRCSSYEWSFTVELLGTLRILSVRNVYDNVYQAEIVVG